MTRIKVDVEDLKALFDIAVHSMDFGSGFLDTDEVNLLRKVAVTIGVDPMNGTPSNFATQYPHAMQQKRPEPGYNCSHCRRPANDPIHTVERPAADPST